MSAGKDSPPPSNAGTPQPSASLSGDRPRRRNAGKPWRTSERRAAGFRQAVRPVSGSTVRRVPRPACQRFGSSGKPRRRNAGKPWRTSERRAASQRFDRPRRVPLPMIPATVRPLQPFAPVSGSEVATIERGQAVATVCRRIPANVAGFFPPCAQPLAVRLAIAATVRVSPA